MGQPYPQSPHPALPIKETDSLCRQHGCTMFPRRRSAHLVVQDLPDETLIFDQRTAKAHCLNQTTALVWRNCDGRNDLAGLARQTGLAEPLVQLALEQLASRRLLEGSIERGSPAQRRSRRELLKQLAAATVALPAILTVTAPQANAAGSAPPFTCSGKPNGTSCGGGQICCSGACCNNNAKVCVGPSPSCCCPPGAAAGVNGCFCDLMGRINNCCSGSCSRDGVVCI